MGSITVPVVLIIGGLFFLLIGLIGTVEALQVKIVHPPAWARLTCVIASLGMFAGGFFLLIRTPESNTQPPGQGSNSGGSPSSSPGASRSSSKILGPPRVTLNLPSAGDEVSRSKGFIASGSVESLGANTIWIVDYDSGYTIDQEAKVVNNAWSAADFPLGDPTDSLPFPLTMRVVLANRKCAAKLQRVSETKDDYIPSLPNGCTLKTGVTVTVAKP